MKRLICISVLCIFCIMTSFADELNSDQLKLRSDMMTVLRNHGYSPSLDSDGDIKWEAKGHTYYASVSPSSQRPMYVQVAIYYTYPDDYSKAVVHKAAGMLATYKGVKVMCTKSYVKITSEFFLMDVTYFDSVLEKVMSQIDSVSEDLRDTYKEAAE